MTLEFQLARAMTAKSLWADPKVIKGGQSDLTADDVRAAVAIALADHPFAYYALMAKWCQDLSCKHILQEELHDFAVKAYHDLQPHDAITGAKHWQLIKYSVEYWMQPEIGQRMGDKGVATHMKVHRDTFRTRYRQHFKRVTGYLFELESTALQDYRRVMRRD